MTCDICNKPFEKTDRVKEDFRQEVLTKLSYEKELTKKTVVATYWGIFRGNDHAPVSIVHTICFKGDVPSRHLRQ